MDVSHRDPFTDVVMFDVGSEPPSRMDVSHRDPSTHVFTIDAGSEPRLVKILATILQSSETEFFVSFKNVTWTECGLEVGLLQQ